MTTTGERDDRLSLAKILITEIDGELEQRQDRSPKTVHPSCHENYRSKTVHLFLQPADLPALLRILSRPDSSIPNRPNPEIDSTGNVSRTGS
jgi:hypothetical protein